MTLRAYRIPENIDASSLPWAFEGERVLKRYEDIVEVDGSIVGYPEVAPSVADVIITPDEYRIAALWQAAHDYEFKHISGSAIGLLAIGVIQAKPKCLAVQAWIKSIWTEYYVRKTGTSTDMDFSFAGKCPHSVPELMEEMGL